MVGTKVGTTLGTTLFRQFQRLTVSMHAMKLRLLPVGAKAIFFSLRSNRKMKLGI